MRARAVLLVVGAVAGLGALAWFLDRRAHALPDLSAHAAAIDAAAREQRVDPWLLRGLVAAESGGDARATSAAGARGLTQLMPATAREQAGLLGLALPDEAALTSDPALNLTLGAAYLRRMLDLFEGDEVYALAAYHSGAARVKRWREAAPGLSPRGVLEQQGGPQARAYVPRVLAFRDAYRAAR